MSWHGTGFRLVLIAVLQVSGLAYFAKGFFPYKAVLPGLANFDDTRENVNPPFEKLVFLVIDALRRFVGRRQRIANIS